MIDPKLALAVRLATNLQSAQKGREDKELVKQFQLQEGLKADGLYGPKTAKVLAHYVPAVTSPFYVTRISGENADMEALATINRTQRGQNLSAAEKQYVLTVARHETFYGKGWKGEGVGSFNMGAVQTSSKDPNTTFLHIDHHADGKEYTAHFKKYPSADAGLDDLIRILLRDNVKAALSVGNGDEAVTSQRANHYFEAPLSLYQKALRRNYESFLKNTNEPRLLTFTVDFDEKKIL